MSADESDAGVTDRGSRQSSAYSVTPPRDANTGELPTPEERVQELVMERPELARTPLASPGTKLREEAVETVEAEPVGVYDVPFGGSPDAETEIMGMVQPDAAAHRSVTVAEAVYAFLRDYADRRGSRVYLEKRCPDGEVVDETEKSAENSFSSEYRRMRYAQLKGFEREIGAGFEEPVVALLGLTASGSDPDGSPRPPADHMREIAAAWSKSGGVRETLRNQLETGLGLEPGDWAYIRGGEPHPGDGENSGYHHDHPAVVVDAAAADGEVTDATFEPVVRKHVAETPTAGVEAHRDAISVREVDPDAEADGDPDEGPVTDVGSYVGAYVAGDAETDLLEEPVPYLVWAATTWATTTQKFTAGRTARSMIDADRCRSEAEEGDHGPHGAKLHCTTDAWGRETVECAYCGSHHDVPETHDEARRSRAALHRGDPLGEKDYGEGDELAELWSDATAAGSVGGPTAARECSHPDGANECPLCAESVSAVPSDVPIPDDAEPAEPPPVESVGFGRTVEPEWSAEELRLADGEAVPIGSPGSVSYLTVNDVPPDAEVEYRGRVGRLLDALDEQPDPAGDAEPVDTRKAVIDAIRDMPAPATAADVAERVSGLDESDAADVLAKLRATGRVISDSGGFRSASD